jgi:gas vesicle protein GvpA/GvpJ/GvpM family
MARRPAPSLDVRRPQTLPVSDQVLEPSEDTVLDLLDHLLNKGVMLNGDVTLGVAGVDLIYLRLSSIFCAADRIMPSRHRTKYRRTPRPPIGRRNRP